MSTGVERKGIPVLPRARAPPCELAASPIAWHVDVCRYEQDWLDTEYDNMLYLNTNATAARTWLLQMGTAAARNDLTIQ